MSLRDAQAACDAAEPEEPPTCATIHDGITLRALESEIDDRGIVAIEVRSCRVRGRVSYVATVRRDSRDVGEGWGSSLSEAVSLAVADYDRGARDA